MGAYMIIGAEVGKNFKKIVAASVDKNYEEKELRDFFR